MLTPLPDPPPGPAPSAACGGGGGAQTHTKWPPSSLRRRLPSPAGPLPRRPRPLPPAAAARWGLLSGHPLTPAPRTRAPRSSGARKAQRGHVTRLPAAILWSERLGWALCIRRGSGRAAGGAAAGPRRPRLQASPRAAGWRSGAGSAFARRRRRQRRFRALGGRALPAAGEAGGARAAHVEPRRGRAGAAGALQRKVAAPEPPGADLGAASSLWDLCLHPSPVLPGWTTPPSPDFSFDP